MTPEQKAAKQVSRVALGILSTFHPAFESIFNNVTELLEQLFKDGAQWQRENGWIEIKSEEDLPKENGKYCVIHKFGDIRTAYHNQSAKSKFTWKEKYTHWLNVNYTPPKTKEDGK